MAISPARLAAFEILLKVETENGFSSELLARHAESLGDRDRSLCHEITLGSLRRQIFLDRFIAELSNGKKLDGEVRVAIRLGLYQLLFLDRVPDYSAINESVELVARAKKASAKGFVNAVLRRASRGAVAISFSDEIDRVSVESSHPRWLLEKWISDFGYETAVGLSFANNEKPKVAFRPTWRLHEQESEELVGLSVKYQPSRYVDGSYVADHVSPELMALESRDCIYFQDEASQLVAQIVRLMPQDRFIDVCAAPGSKTTAIAAHSAKLDPHPLIVAGDINERRTLFLKDNCEKQGLETVRCIRYDASSALPFADNSFDVVLVDAPCTGTGTLRHNPEIRYRLDKPDFERSASKQLMLLRSAARLTVPGGRLFYSTCSLEIEENEMVIRSFLDSDADFMSVLPGLPERFLTPEGFARTFPSRDEMDGFFIAVLEKKGL